MEVWDWQFQVRSVWVLCAGARQQAAQRDRGDCDRCWCGGERQCFFLSVPVLCLSAVCHVVQCDAECTIQGHICWKVLFRESQGEGWDASSWFISCLHIDLWIIYLADQTSTKCSHVLNKAQHLKACQKKKDLWDLIPHIHAKLAVLIEKKLFTLRWCFLIT